MEGKVPVSERALFQRIQRKLNSEGKKLFRSRGYWTKQNLGKYHIIGADGNVDQEYPASIFEDIEKMAREFGVIATHEYYAGPKPSKERESEK